MSRGLDDDEPRAGDGRGELATRRERHSILSTDDDQHRQAKRGEPWSELRHGGLGGDDAAEGVGEPVRRVLEEALADEPRGFWVESRRRAPHEPGARSLEAVALDGLGEAERDRGEATSGPSTRGKAREDESVHTPGLGEREAQRGSRAHGEAAHDRLLRPDPIEDAAEVGDERLGRVRVGLGRRRAARVSARVETRDAVACAERPCLGAEVPGAPAEPVGEHDDGPAALDVEVQGRLDAQGETPSSAWMRSHTGGCE